MDWSKRTESRRRIRRQAELFGTIPTYLSQLAADGGPDSVGVLLYAGLGPGQPLRYRLGGHTLLVRSLDLNRDWRDIHTSLMTLVKGLAGLQETHHDEPAVTESATGL
jgi:hypothetical protein